MAGPLKIYEVTVGGNRTTMKLTEAEAKRIGATEVGTKKRTAQNKARTPVADKADDPDEDSGNVCDVCGFEAKTSGGLAAHQRSHEDG